MSTEQNPVEQPQTTDLTTDNALHYDTEIKDPTAEHEYFWLYEEREDLWSKYDYEDSKSGKWMIFVKLNSMFSMWKKSCNLYREGKLEGIIACDDQELMMRYGRNLVTVLQFFTSKGAIPYKSDAQTALGTRATGCKVNSMYWVRVPRTRDEWKQHEGKNFWRVRGISSSSGNWRSELTRSDQESWRSPGKYKDLEKSTGIDQASWRSPVDDRKSWRSTGNHQTSWRSTVNERTTCKSTGNDRTSFKSTRNDRTSCKFTGNGRTLCKSTGNDRT
ncbi:uncharacterized protein LOC108664889 isoform X2 [Hyalella azteca]|uniref:Uncharacterized protein LOC108664889 isoform X2 n=1 Tax=Hyalella azteca TaxID=294128 RepID=A0A8B7MZR3_HYAAZ|nr:uncharacterized protein LOC108664889 isoform X2 [Hyalella azteca]